MDGETVLDVTRSATGRVWRPRLDDSRIAQAIAQAAGVPEIVGRILAARGVGPETAEDFLNPSLRALLPDPSGFRDMD
ncbi:MAG TPA: single-stranded-DNA-specific exonuclease RecJ, partial [Alphaproteobacteria bacterium]|nr:single-stranded-DNA-specific exonuclease RecJ [Alphaproteobacteria bacterium]